MSLSWADALSGANKAEPAPVVGPITPADGETRYAATALAQEAERVRSAVEGTRNHTLNEAAFKLATLVAAGALAYAEVKDTLLAAAMQAGLGRVEAERTIGSGFRGGRAKPRDLSGVRELTPPNVQEVGTMAVQPQTGASQPNTANPDLGEGQADVEAAERARTSWWAEPIEHLAAAAEATPEPDVFVRSDGRGLFYRGKVNGLIGESESGKSWCALHACHQEIAGGGRVMVLDFEDTAKTTLERLAALGATREALARVWYAAPDQALDLLASADLTEALASVRPGVIVLDGFNAAMTLLGLDLNSNTDATAFAVKLLRPLSATGAAVITVDHVPKNPEARGKGGIGAQAKRAMLTGCALRVEVSEPFGRGQSGKLKLYVDKDRPGHVRGYSGGGKYAGTFNIDSLDNDHIRAEIEAPQPAGTWRPTRLMEAISDYLDRNGPTSKNGIEIGVTGSRDRIREALQYLVADGHVVVGTGSRGAVVCTLAHPFAAAVEEVDAETDLEGDNS